MADRLHVYYVYILTTRKNTVLYTGVTNDLLRRCLEHKEAKVSGFTKRYSVHKLVYYERFRYVRDAIAREKEIKGWLRCRKVELIAQANPHWEELFEYPAIKPI